MAEITNDKRVLISPDRTALANYVADRFLRRIEKQVDEPAVHVSLTGGTMGVAVLAAAALNPRLAGLRWDNVHFWWSDERFVPRHDDERNEKQAREALLDQLDIPPGNIHSVAASDEGVGLDEAARAYADELARFAQPGGPAWPSFDMCFLGVGPDAHIASLFPDHPEIRDTEHAVLPVRNSPKPPPERVTFTRPVINGSQRVWLVMSGPDKAAALGLALAGANYTSVPAGGAKGRRRTVFFVDREAAEQVPPELIDQEY